jgi:hypothetical protein
MLPANEGGVLKTRGLFLAAAALAALLLAAGCGGSSDPEITVQSGSLSKAEFIEKADAICKAARTEFLAKYSSFVEAHKSDIGNASKEKVLLEELVESTLSPNVEGQIEQISELGAPSDYAPEVAAFLNAFQKRLDEMRENPSELTSSSRPFEKAENVAKKAGMSICAENLA